MTPTHRIEREARPENLGALLGFVDSVCAEAALPDDVAFAVRLAAEEACTNVINHGYRGQATGLVAITISRDAELVVVNIEDQGAPLDPDSIPAADINSSAEERLLGGLGWHLISKVMDHVHHEYDPATGNKLTLVKRLSSPVPQ